MDWLCGRDIERDAGGTGVRGFGRPSVEFGDGEGCRRGQGGANVSGWSGI